MESDILSRKRLELYKAHKHELTRFKETGNMTWLNLARLTRTFIQRLDKEARKDGYEWVLCGYVKRH